MYSKRKLYLNKNLNEFEEICIFFVATLKSDMFPPKERRARKIAERGK